MRQRPGTEVILDVQRTEKMSIVVKMTFTAVGCYVTENIRLLFNNKWHFFERVTNLDEDAANNFCKAWLDHVKVEEDNHASDTTDSTLD
jgi:hypothetical protein